MWWVIEGVGVRRDLLAGVFEERLVADDFLVADSDAIDSLVFLHLGE